MLKRKGQSALEYMMTYGWAILIIVIVAVILYSMGIFNPSSSITTTITGFGSLGVTQALCINSVNNQILGLYITNNAGYPVNITTINVSGNNGISINQKIGSTLNPSQSALFYVNGACNKSSSTYSGSATIIYTEPGQPLPGPYISTGKVSNVQSKSDPNLVANFSGGTPHYISLPKNSVVNISHVFSVLVWFKTKDYGPLVFVGDNSMPNYVGAWWNTLYVASNGSIFGGDAGGPIFETGYVVSNGQWNMAVITQSSSPGNMTLYLNGVNIGIIPFHTPSPFSPYYWVIGGGTSNGANWPYLPPKAFFNGSISNVQIYDVVLSSSQINKLYLEGLGGAPTSNLGLVGWWLLDGNANDYSGNNNNGIPSNVNWVSP